MKAAYICDVIGDGASTATAYRPALADVVPGLQWDACDGRASVAVAGRMLVIADVTPAEHALLVADPRITFLPFAGTGGVALDLATATLGDVSAANRTTLRTRLAAWHVSTDDLGLDTPIVVALRRIRRRLLLRQLLGPDDYTEGLDTLVSDLSVNRRQAIAARLTAAGFDVSTIVGTDTIREALRKLAVQDGAPLFRGA